MRLRFVDMDAGAGLPTIGSHIIFEIGLVENVEVLPEEDALKLIPTYLEGATSWMRNLETRIHEGGPFFGGASPHHGDFNTFHMVDQITTLDGGAALQQCGLPVQIWFASVASLPAVALYLNERPKAGTGLLGKPGSLIHERSEPHVRL